MNPNPEDTFADAGYWGPIDLLSPAECSLLSRYFDDRSRPRPLEWSKGGAATDRVVYELATRAQLASLLQELVGPDVVLWGASVVDRDPGQEHVWHTDIETSAADFRGVTVWIGLEHTSLESALQLIRGSHLLGKTLQQVAAEDGIPRAALTASVALEAARRLRADACLLQPDMRDGQAILFDGRAWHGSLNTRSSGRRRALLLQYAAASVPLRIPDWNHLEWPFVFKDEPRPPVLALGGKADRKVNRLVAAPPWTDAAVSPLRSLRRAIPSPLPRDIEKGWKPYPLYRGSTPILKHLGCHVSVLEPGHTPHAPHAHLDEELLVVISGEADIVIATGADDAAPRVERLHPGDMAYYPSYQFHTIRCPGPSPVSYLMYRWQASLTGGSALPTGVFRAGNGIGPGPKAFSTSLVFEGPTGFLPKLHVHRSHVRKDGGYKPHADAHDVALLLLNGEIETQGRRLKAPAVAFYPSGAAHGLRGRGVAGAEYLVVEFHGPRGPVESRISRLQRAALNGLQRARRKVKRAFSAASAGSRRR